MLAVPGVIPLSRIRHTRTSLSEFRLFYVRFVAYIHAKLLQ
jgi:hypothetical protein